MKLSQLLTVFGEIEGRVKQPESLHEKLSRKGKTLDQINDIVGMRCTTQNMADVYTAVNALKQKFGEQIVEIDDKTQNPLQGYYRAVHMTLMVEGKQMEMQVRTRNQSRIAIWAHDRFYKTSNTIPSTVVKYLVKVSKAMYRADTIGGKVTLPKCPPPILPDCFRTDFKYTESRLL